MKRLFVYLLLLLVLALFCFSCSVMQADQTSAVAVNTPKGTNAVISEPTPTPIPTPVPILKPVKILANRECIIKIYDNGEFGYIGELFSKSWAEAYQRQSIDDAIKVDMIEAGIPVILEDWMYDNITQYGQKPKAAYILKSELDQAEYDSKYGDKLNEIKNRYKPKQIDDFTSIVDIQKGLSSNAYLVNTDKQQGIVFAEMFYSNENFDDWEALSECVYDPFDGVQVTDIAIGTSHVVGVTKDGKVLSYLAQNPFAKDLKQTDTADWEGIVDVAAGSYHTIGLKSDGTVFACGDNRDKQCDVSDWEGIVAVEATGNYSFGLKNDGSVVTTGSERFFKFDVSGWTDIVELKVDHDMVAGLKRDGTVVISGETPDSGLGVYKWDTSRGAILNDIVSINLIDLPMNSALVALNSKGEIYILNVYDYFMNYEEFKTGIDDIAATGGNTFAVLKGDQILYSVPNSQTNSWGNILKNEGRYAIEPFEGFTTVSITDDGKLKVNEVFNDNREGIFTYPSKISKICISDVEFRRYLLLTENGDVVYVEAVNDYQGPMKFESIVLFDSVKEHARAIKIYGNFFFCTYLDENGNLYYPKLLQQRLMKGYCEINWDNIINWNRDAQSPFE